MHGLGMWSVAFHNSFNSILAQKSYETTTFKTPVFYGKFILGTSIKDIVNVVGAKGQKLVKVAHG